jgi:hypothetical protein
MIIINICFKTFHPNLGSHQKPMNPRLAAVQQPALAGCRASARGGLAGFNETFFCNLLSSIRPVAGLLCAGGSTALFFALCWPLSGSRLRPVPGLQRVGGSPASTTPSAALCVQQSGSQLQLVAGLLRV